MADGVKSKSVGDILKTPLPKPKELIGEGILSVGHKMLLYGKPKTLKSGAVKRLMLSASTGADWLGFHTTKCKVLYVQLELTDYEIQERLGLMKPTQTSEGACFIWTTRYLKLDTLAGAAELDDEISCLKPELVIIDPIYKVLSGDMNRSVFVMPMLDNMDLLIEKHQVGVVMVHHQRKGALEGNRPGKDNGAEEMAGAFSFGAWPDTVIGVKRRQSELTFTVDFARNARKDFDPIRSRIDPQLQFEVGFPPIFRI